MDERQKAIDTVIKNMEKSFGKGAVMKLGDDAGRKVSTVSSGSITLDKALGVGGYPKGQSMPWIPTMRRTLAWI